jgi:addiction module HigA family antidote
LAEELKELGMSAAELARQLDVPTNRVTEILNGRRTVTGDTALRLAHFFGTTAEFWLNLQSLYDPHRAEEGGKIHSAVADPEAGRTGPRVKAPGRRRNRRRRGE